MGVTQKRLCTLLVFIIVIIEATGTDINDTSPEENRRSPGRGRIIKQYSGTRPEPVLCAVEGFLSDPHNCATFYRCVKSGNDKYTVFRFQCGPGTVYDPDEKVCNHPQNTRRAECGGFLPPVTNDSHLNEIQGLMYNEIPSPMKPIYPPNTLQQSTIMNAEATSPSNTIQSTTRPYPWGSSTNPSYMDHNAMIMRPIRTESNIPHPISRDNICTSDGFMGDSENCRKFYRCVANQRGGYTRYEFSCTETTIWDDYNQICNHIWAVRKTRCSLLGDKITMSNTNLNNEQPHSWDKNVTGKPIRENTPNNTVQNQLQISYGPQVTQTQTQISNGFVNQNQTQINYGDRLNQEQNEGSKQNQTQISNGSAISQSQTQIDYGDKGVQMQLQIDHSNNASQNQIQIIDSSKNKVSTTIHNSDNQESDKHDSVECTETGFIGDNTDCAKFYRCVDNGQGGFKKFGFTCADGTAWDPSLNTCNHIWALKGCNSSSFASTTQTSTTATDKTTQTYYPTTSTERTTPQPTGNDNESTGYVYPKPDPTPTSSLSPTLTTIFDAKDTECTSSGFMGDKNNCKIFYRCVENGSGGFTKYMFNCGEGTVWDPEIEACNHAWAVENCGENASPDITKIDTTTGKITSSSPVYIQSTVATHSPTESFPDHSYEDNDVGYGSSNNNIQTSTTSSKYPANIQPDGNSAENDKTTSSSTIESVLIDGVKCTHSGFMGDPNDCKKFFRCVDNGSGSFTKFEFRCGEGTVWDDEIKSCNHAWAVAKCGGSSESSPINDEINNVYTSEKNTEPSVVITTSTTEKSAVTNSSNNNSEKNETSFDCTEEGFIGDPNNCKIFYRCVDDGEGSLIKYQYNCGEGTYWNQEILSCDHLIDNKTCKGIESSSTTKVPNVHNEANTESTTISEDENHQQKPTSKPPNSPVICTSEGFHGDKYDCRQFYRCVNNGNGGYDIYYFNCGEGTVWDQELLTCNHESLSKCTSLALTDNQSPPESVPTTSTTTMGSVMHDEDDTQSMQTTTRWETTKNEATASQDLSSTTTTTIVSSTSTPSPEFSSNTDLLNTDTCNNEGFYGNTQDCKKFYRCVSNGKGGYTKYDFDCAEGTIWDKDVITCNHPENVVHPSCNLTQDSNSSSINCTKAGFYANPNDCKKFYRCVDWDGNQTKFSIYHFDCGEGTIWDPAIETCNHEDSVYPPRNCSGSESQSATTEGTATTKYESTMQSISQTTSESITTQSATESISQSTTESTSQSATELTTFSATESITTSITESTTLLATQSTTPPTTESTTLSGTELTTSSGTETITISTTELSTLSPTETAPTSINESTTPQNLQATESITTSTIESITFLATEKTTTPLATESTTFSITESITSPTMESTTTSTTESTTLSATESITPSTTESTTTSTTESTTLSATESTTPSTTESTTTSTTESTTLSATESTTPSTTESTTTSTTESTTLSATESTTPSTTESTTTSTTESTTLSGTESTTLSTIEPTTTSNTESTTPSVYDSTTTSTTESTFPLVSESTPPSVIESITPSITESTTLSTTESTTKSTTESTTLLATETITPSVTELTAPSAAESTASSATESTTLSGIESTSSTLSTMESTTTLTTESTTPSVFDSTTTSTTESTTLSAIELITPSTMKSTTTSTTVLTTLSATESTTPLVFKSTTSSVTESITTSITESTTLSPTELTTKSATESTSFSTTESTTPSVPESTAPSVTESTTPSITEPTTPSATESTTLSGTESTVLSTMESTTTSTTELTAPSVSDSTTTSTTDSSTLSNAESTSTSTTESTTLSATESITPSATESTTTSTTESSTLSATESTTTSTTESTILSTTELITESTTKSTTESTISTSGEQTTTERSEEGTTGQSTQSTTEYTTQSTIEQSGQSTTEQLGESTTTERSEGSTTEKSGASTTETSGASTTENSQNTSTEKPSPEDCPATEDDQYLFVCPSSFRRHPKYCNLFYQCDESEDTHDIKIAMFTCPNNTIYDESKTKCVEESKAQKRCDGEVAQKRRVKRKDRIGNNVNDPIQVTEDSYACPDAGFYAFEKDGDCSPGFLKCMVTKTNKLRGLVYQCPAGYLFWTVSRRCEPIYKINDCRRSVINNWSRRWEIPVERRNVAW